MGKLPVLGLATVGSTQGGTREKEKGGRGGGSLGGEPVVRKGQK